MAAVDCISEADLTAFLLGTLPPRLSQAVSSHLNSCPQCEMAARRLDALSDPVIRSLRQALAPAGNRPEADTLTGDGGAAPEPTEAKAPCLPRQVAGYTILGELGRGGMNVVYLAQQAHPARLVALKMILGGGHTEAERRARFLAEADAIARLQHPNIVQIYEVGTHDDLPFLALEYVDGGSLAERLRGAPLPPRQAAALLEPLARAAHFAHEHGVIHRDLKPANILMQAHGSQPVGFEPKITDFGLAKQERSDLTATGAVLGTPQYMAPEQAAGKGKEVGPAADTYALGTILYECLTGRPPFLAATSLDTLAQVLADEPVPPRRLNRQVPRDLETVCLKCLHKDPRQRYASAGELAEDLGRWQRGEPVRARPVGTAGRFWRWCRRRPAVAGLSAAVVALLLVLTAGLLFTVGWLRFRVRASEEALQWLASRDEALAARSSGRPGQRLRALAAIRKARGLTLPPGHTLDELRTEAIAALCLPDWEELQRWDGWPEGTTSLAFDGTLATYARALGSGEVSIRRVAGDAEVWHFKTELSPVVMLSPDARFTLVEPVQTRQGPMEVWRRTETGAERCWSEPAVVGEFFAFSPDSRLLLYQRTDRTVVLYDLQAGKPAAQWPPGPRRYWTFAFAPDGKRLALGAGDAGPPLVEVREVPSGAVTARLPTGGSLAWDPDGRRLAVGRDDLFIHLWDVAAQKELAAWPGHRTVGIWPLTFNRSGSRLLSTDWSSQVHVWDTASGEPVLATPLNQVGAALVPDDGGLRLVAREGLHSLRLLRLVEGGEHQVLTPRPAPGWGKVGGIWKLAPDARLLFTDLTPPANSGLAVVDPASGQVLAALPSPSARQSVVLGFDPSGDLLTYDWAGFGLLRWPIRENPATGVQRVGPPRRLFWERGADKWGMSADGQVIAIPRYDGAVVGRLDRPGRWLALRPQQDVRYCAVSPDGTWVATGSWLVQPGKSSCKVWRAADGALVKELPLLNGGVVVAFSPDGRWLGTQGNDSGTRLWRVGTWEEGPLLSEGSFLFAFAPDGRTVAVGDKPGVVRLCATDSGRELARLEVADLAEVQPVGFSHDGARLYARRNGEWNLHVWDLRVIRRELAEMGLDWDAEPLPDPPAEAPRPVPAVEVDAGAVAQFAAPPNETPARRVERCSAILKADPDDVEAYHDRAHAYETLGRFAEAVADFTEALKRWPDNAHFVACRGTDHVGLKQYTEAAADLERSLALDENQAGACNQLARLQVTGPEPLRNPGKALPLAERAVKLAGGQATYHNTLGIVYYRNGRYQDAIRELDASLRGGRGQFDAFDLYFQAMCHQQLGEAEKAKACFDRAARWQEGRKLPAYQREVLQQFRVEAGKVLGIEP
jgi:WD40 repeat protein/Flp pilus assembly protein TadD